MDRIVLQTTARLISTLAANIEVMKDHIAAMDDLTLDSLTSFLPPTAPPGSAEMVMTLLVYREMKDRKVRHSGDNIIPFPRL
jgi:hypothetical protein